MNDLKKLVESIRSASDIPFVESIKRKVLSNTIDAGITSASLENQTTVDGLDVTAPKPYDQRVRVTIDGTDYYIGLYDV